MTKAAFDKIAEGLREAIAVARGEREPARLRSCSPKKKIQVTIERRDDGGLRIYSADLPGLVLSHSDARAVLADLGPALAVLLGLSAQPAE